MKDESGSGGNSGLGLSILIFQTYLLLDGKPRCEQPVRAVLQNQRYDRIEEPSRGSSLVIVGRVRDRTELINHLF
jgi:hypothetical protein